MINKRHFLGGGVGTLVALPSLAVEAGQRLTDTPPRLDAQSGLATWQAFVGQPFDVDGVALRLTAAVPRDATGLQFSLHFEALSGPSPAEGLLTVGHAQAQGVALFMAATPTGLRADFCRQVG